MERTKEVKVVYDGDEKLLKKKVGEGFFWLLK